jgi:hypothetical protein
MRNQIFSVYIVALVSVLTGGCSLREKREERNARRGAELTEMIQGEQEVGRATVATSDLESRISYFQALEGEYLGQHLQSSFNARGVMEPVKRHLAIRIRLTAVGIPAEFSRKRARRESEIVAQMDALRFTADVFEGDPDLGVVHVACSVEDVRPDFNLGLLRFTCPATTIYPARTFVVSLESGDDGSEHSSADSIESASHDSVYDTIETLYGDRSYTAPEYSRSSAVASGLLKGRIRRIHGMNIEILTASRNVRAHVVRNVSVR